MHIKKGDQKMFWKLLDKLDNSKKDIFQNSVPGNKWNDHFKSIFRDQSSDSELPPDCPQKGPLYSEISMDEIHKASYILKNNKATGYDMISNEMIMCLIRVQPELLLKLFKEI